MEQDGPGRVTRPCHHPRTASRVFGGEAVIITPAEDNMVRLLDAVGARIWQLADGSRTVGEISAALVDEYDVAPDEALTSAHDFLVMLDDKGLLAWV